MNILILIYLILHIIVSWQYTPYLWGVDAISFAHPIIIISFTAIVILSLIPNIRQYFEKIFINIIKLTSKTNIPLWLIILLIALSIFTPATHFLGDGYLRIRNAELGILFSASEPLDTFLHAELFKILNPVFKLSAGDIYSITSRIAAIIVFVSFWKYLKEKNIKPEFIALAVLLFASAGTTQLFSGYVESYSLAAMFLFLFILTSVKTIEKQIPDVLPSVYFTLAILCHSSSIVLLPALIFIILKMYKFENGKKVILNSVILNFIIIIVTLTLLGLITNSNIIEKYLIIIKSSKNLLPVFTNNFAYGILSPEHLLDILNEFLLILPALLALPLIWKYFKDALKQNKYQFLLIVASGYLFIILFFNPVLGFARDWDLFSLIAIPTTIFIILTLLENQKKLLYNTIPLLIISLIHTFSWIGVNSSENLSIQRIQKIVETPYWTNKSKALLYDELSQFYHNKKDYLPALIMNENAYKYENNPRYLFSNATISLEINDLISAENYLLRLTKTNYKSALVFNYLGDLYFDTQQPHKALIYYKKAYQFDTTNLSAVNNMGLIYLSLAQFPEAEKQFLISIKKFPEDARLNYYLAICSFNKKDFSQTLKFLDISEKYGYKKTIIDALRNEVLKQMNTKN
jgi:tetratricopeptide (TPR) repeat protein